MQEKNRFYPIRPDLFCFGPQYPGSSRDEIRRARQIVQFEAWAEPINGGKNR